MMPKKDKSGFQKRKEWQERNKKGNEGKQLLTNFFPKKEHYGNSFVEELPSGLPPLPSYEEAVRLPNIPNPVPPPPDYAKTMQEPCPPHVNSPPPVMSPPQVTVQNVVCQQSLGEDPVQIQCPACLQVVVTRLEHSSGILTWILCASLFIVGCSYGCCLIPFCWDGLKDVTHYCPSCHQVLGVFRRL